MKSNENASQILNLLKKHPAGLTKEQISRKTSIGSDSTFFRALRFAQTITNNAIVRTNNKYQLTDSIIENDVSLLLPSDEELIALVAIEHIISSMTSDTLRNVFAPIQKKINQTIKLIAKRPNGWFDRIRILDTHYRKIESGVFVKISQSIAKERVIRFQYTDRKGAKTVRTVSPQHLIRYRDNWYLDAWCHNSNELRCFSLDCINEIKHDNQPFVTVKDNELRTIYATSYGIFTGTPIGIAIIRFTGNAARYAQREIWHPEQKISKHKDGSVQLHIPYNNATELIGAILTWGEEAEVISPVSLRKEIEKKIFKMYLQYHEKIALD